ncbi:MAG TPA: hypothetical protein VFP98_07955 [Candidatus Polarisedimenticolia bacterium]|nr:hypothetical protein [Candidatus Polarisedimenticolia bacterium]
MAMILSVRDVVSECAVSPSRKVLGVLLAGTIGLSQPAMTYSFIDTLQADPSAPTCANEILLSVSGVLADRCWELSGIAFAENTTSFLFTVHGNDKWNGSAGCAQQPVPYSASGLVGPLPPGSYVLRVEEIYTQTVPRPPPPETRELTFEVQCCTPTPASVSDLQVVLVNNSSQLQFTWSNVLDAEDYVLYVDTSPIGFFRTAVASATCGTDGIVLPAPAQTEFFLLASRNSVCGEGYKR